MSKISLFVSCHKPCKLIHTDIITPIQVGTALNGSFSEEILHDNTGDNISEKNKSYCELTAQYWAWKNHDADYYGFMHYRRYFSFADEALPEDAWGNIVYPYINDHFVDSLNLKDDKIRSVIEGTDIISVTPQNTRQLDHSLNVYTQYKKSRYHLIKDLDLVISIINELYPDFSDVTRRYLKGTTSYFCNMFILRKDLFMQYSEWLFTILEEFEKRSHLSDYDFNEYRVIGFLAERLWGIYYTYLKETGLYRWKELQKAFLGSAESPVDIHSPFSDSKSCVPIVTAADNKYVPYVSVMLHSLISNASPDRNYDFIILTKDISQKNKELLWEEFSANKNLSIRFFDVSFMYASVPLPTHIQHISVETYYRLLMQDILKNYDKVLYLDSDLVVLDDISKLYDADLGDNLIGGIKDIDMAGNCRNKQKRYRYLTNNLGLKDPYGYVNAGVLAMNLSAFRQTFTEKDILDAIAAQEYLYQDQDILNRLCDGRIAYLDMGWNVLMNYEDTSTGTSRMNIAQWAPHQIYFDYMASRKNIKIAHYAGACKPWDEPECDLGQYFWEYAKESAFFNTLQNNLNTTKEVVAGKATGTNYERLKYDFDQMQSSVSFRIGRVITWAPRKVRDVLFPKNK